MAYLPTISLIVFVKTPFRASAKDTAGAGRLTESNKQLGEMIAVDR